MQTRSGVLLICLRMMHCCGGDFLCKVLHCGRPGAFEERVYESPSGRHVRRFDRGCHFVPLIVNDTAEKLRHFIDGLKPTIRRDVMMMEPAEYAAATTRAFWAEQTLKNIDFEIQRKRQQGQSSQQPNKRPYTGPPRVQGHHKPQGPQRQQGQQKPLQLAAPNTGDKPFCRECNRPHSDKCMQGSFRCFFARRKDTKLGIALRRVKQ